MSPRDLVGLVKQSGLDAIEWAGNAHVLPGDLAMAKEVRGMTEDAGLEVASYGSYYKVVDEAGKVLPIEPVLESALALGAPTVRIWAGVEPSDALSSAARATIVDKIRADLVLAEKAGVKLALEFHANTLSDSNDATTALLDEVDHPNFLTYWQPVYWLTDMPYRIEGLEKLASRVANLHVFQWIFRPGRGSWGDSTDRRPLAEGAKEWLRYLSVPLDPAIDHYALMEFVRDDSPEQFLEDAAVLKQWLEQVSRP